MRPRLLTILIFLLTGAMVNVAVAWGCACFAPDTQMSERISGSVDSRVNSLVDDVDLVLWTAKERSGCGYDILETTARPLVESGWVHPSVEVITGEAGLPLRSVYGHWIARGQFAPRRVYALSAPDALAGDVLSFLPYHPTWPGFAVNTIFYAAILWLLIPGPFVLRRFIRLRRGLCPKCAYPMGESSVCTECGCELRARTT